MQTVRRFALSIALCVAVSCTSSDRVQREQTNVQTPKVIQRVEPEYPAELRQQRVAGAVEIGGTVPKEGGALRNPRVVRSDDSRLNQLALEAVSRWIWSPGLQDGKPVDVEFTTQVHFSVRP
jgi:periplasmic protein TonB